MASPETATGRRSSRAMLLRGLGFAVAIVLGGIAVWLIATGSTVKAQRIGALSGMWGVLVGAYSIFGARRHEEPVLEAGTALELRQSAAIARSEDVAWQREFQARLEALLRREVQEGVSRELAGLRHEVAALRTEILEKVGGQLRMERTETTRLFGSNLEALQREVRLLKVAQLGDTGTIDAIDVTTYEPPVRVAAAPPAPAPEPARAAEPVRAAEPAPAAEPADPESAGGYGRPPAELLRPSMPTYPAVPPDAGNMPFPPFRPLQPVRAFSSPNEDEPVEPAPEPAMATLPDPLPAPAPYVSEPLPSAPLFTDPIPFPPYPAPAATSGPLPVPPQAEPGAPVTAPAASAIPAYGPPPPAFVPSLPLPHVPPPAPPTEPAQAAPAAEPAPAAPATAPAAASSIGSDDPFASMPRIRPFTDFELDAVDRDAQPWQPSPADSGSARHSSATPPPAPGTGGRRRRTDDSDNDVLAQILAREKAPHPPQ